MNFADRASKFALPGRTRRDAALGRRRRGFRRFALQERHNFVAGGFRFVRRAHLLDRVRNAHQHRAFHALANPFEKVKIHRFPSLASFWPSARRAPSRLFRRSTALASFINRLGARFSPLRSDAAPFGNLRLFLKRSRSRSFFDSFRSADGRENSATQRRQTKADDEKATRKRVRPSFILLLSYVVGRKITKKTGGVQSFLPKKRAGFADFNVFIKFSQFFGDVDRYDHCRRRAVATNSRFAPPPCRSNRSRFFLFAILPFSLIAFILFILKEPL